MKQFFISLCGLLVLSSHTLYLKTDTYFLNPDQASELYLFNGTFETSENTITRDRIIDPQIIGPEYKFIPGESDWYDKDNITHLKFKPAGAGTYVAGISTRPKTIDLTAEEFNEYLQHDGVLDILALRQQTNQLQKPATEFYAKHVKAVLQVGNRRTAEYQQVFNYPLEFVPLTNPYALQEGDKISFSVMVKGKPLPNQLVYVGHRLLTTTAAVHDHEQEESFRTDAKGVFSFTVDHQGIWYLTAIHMVESNDPAYDYISNWATLTFAVK